MRLCRVHLRHFLILPTKLSTTQTVFSISLLSYIALFVFRNGKQTVLLEGAQPTIGGKCAAKLMEQKKKVN